jgi:PAS domain S-box-containing protein
MTGSKSNLFRSPVSATAQTARPGVFFIITIIVLAVIIGGGGWLYYRNQSIRERRAVHEMISTVSVLRAADLADWYRERSGNLDVARLGLDTLYALTSTNATTKTNVVRRLGNFCRVYEYAAAIVTDTNGTIRAMAPTNFAFDPSVFQKNAQAALHSSTIVRSDLRDSEDKNPSPYFWWSHAVYPLMQTNGAPIGTLSLVIDLRNFVFPRLDRWPVPTRTGRSVLVMRTNDVVIFRSPTESQVVQQSSNTVRGRPTLVKLAMLGGTGVYDAQDASGEAVIASQCPVEGTPWLIQSRIDEREALGLLRRESREVALIIGLMLLIVGAGAKTYWRQKALALTRASEERMRMLIDDAPEGVAICQDGTISYANATFQRMFGYADLDEIATKPVSVFWSALNQPPASDGAQQHEFDTPGEYEGIARRKDKTEFPIRVSMKSVTLPEGRAHLAFVRDITESHKLEELVRQSQKMEGIGQLAGGIAHDFNNILAAMMMQTELLQRTQNLPPDVIEGLKQINSYSERAANLTRQLLLFSRKQVLQPRNVDLNELVLSMTRMLQRIIGEHYSLKLHLSSPAVQTRADAGMLDQVLLNLVNNARDAMSGGGEIVVEIGQITLSAAQAQTIPEAREGVYAYLSVVDQGVGIPPENLKHIFEPFFTTKSPGKGTGLGLATVFGIVQLHRGFITINSEVGRGTTIQIHLPMISTTPETKTETSFFAKTHRGSETVFVVEDEEAVRELTRTILEASGYKVIEAANGLEAQRIWKDVKGEVDLLFTDMVMPEGVSGWELADKFRQQNPELKVIFASGYSAEYANRELRLKNGQLFLQKPYSSKQILKAVRECLAA